MSAPSHSANSVKPLAECEAFGTCSRSIVGFAFFVLTMRLPTWRVQLRAANPMSDRQSILCCRTSRNPRAARLPWHPRGESSAHPFFSSAFLLRLHPAWQARDGLVASASKNVATAAGNHARSPYHNSTSCKSVTTVLMDPSGV